MNAHFRDRVIEAMVTATQDQPAHYKLRTMAHQLAARLDQETLVGREFKSELAALAMALATVADQLELADAARAMPRPRASWWRRMVRRGWQT